MSDDALIRRANLKSLGFGPNELLAKIGKTYQYWRDLMETNKSFGEKTARNIEEKLELPRGWLDSVRTHTSFTQGYPDTKATQAPVDTAQSATNAVALSAECQSLCSMFDSLPGDALVRAKALIQIEAIIAAAREPPTKRPMPESWQDTKKSA